MSLCFGSCFVYYLYYLSLDLRSNHIFFSLYLSYKHCTNLLSLNDSNFLSSLSTHFSLILLNLGSIDSSLEIHHLPVIFTFHISHLLSLLIFDCQLLVAILFDMILQRILKLSLFLKSLSKFGVDINIGNATILT